MRIAKGPFRLAAFDVVVFGRQLHLRRGRKFPSLNKCRSTTDSAADRI